MQFSFHSLHLLLEQTHSSLAPSLGKLPVNTLELPLGLPSYSVFDVRLTLVFCQSYENENEAWKSAASSKPHDTFENTVHDARPGAHGLLTMSYWTASPGRGIVFSSTESAVGSYRCITWPKTVGIHL